MTYKTTRSFEVIAQICIRTNNNQFVSIDALLINEPAQQDSCTTHPNVIMTGSSKMLAQITIRANDGKVISSAT